MHANKKLRKIEEREKKRKRKACRLLFSANCAKTYSNYDYRVKKN